MKIICIDVPERVRELLSLTADVTTFETWPTAEVHWTDFDCAFVGGDTTVAHIQKITAKKRPVGICPKVVTRSFMTNTLLRCSIDVVIEGENPDWQVVETGLQHMRRRVEERNLAPTLTLKLGDHFTFGDSDDRARTYRDGASLAAVSASTQEFLRTLRSIALAINRTALPTLKPKWDPTKLTPSKAAHAGNALPGLADLFVDDRDNRLGVGDVDERREKFPIPGSVLIRGESGTGKSLVADLLWRQLSDPDVATPRIRSGGVRRPKPPFVKINCGGLTAQNFDHDLFGARANYWTGISQPVVGLLAQADYGVAFFDEIGDLDQTAQSRLKAFLDDHVIRPSGIGPYYGHLWVIAATNVELESSGFQHDLRQRFTYTLTVPPLTQRLEEIPRLVDYAAQNPAVNPLTSENKLSVTEVDGAALKSLREHDWSDGNFRELRQVVEGAVFRAHRDDRTCVLSSDVEESYFVKPEPAQRRREVRLTADLDVRDALVLASERDLIKTAILHDVPILVGPGGRWVRTAQATYTVVKDKEND